MLLYECNCKTVGSFYDFEILQAIDMPKCLNKIAESN